MEIHQKMLMINLLLKITHIKVNIILHYILILHNNFLLNENFHLILINYSLINSLQMEVRTYSLI